MPKLKCAECGKDNLDSLWMHILRSHKPMTINEYKSKYNYDGPFLSNEQRNKVSLGGKRYYKDPKNKERYYEHQAKKRKNNPDMYKKNSKTMALRTMEFGNRFSESKNKKPFTGTNEFGRQIEYHGDYLNSKPEHHIAKLLRALNVTYLYEKLRFAYEKSDGYWSCYIPDFYLPDYNLILEVKGSKHLYSMDYELDRMYICMSQGFKFMFVTELTTMKDLKLILNAAPSSNGSVKTDLNCENNLKLIELQYKDEINLSTNA